MKVLSKKKLLQKAGVYGRLAPQRNKLGKSSSIGGTSSPSMGSSPSGGVATITHPVC